MALSRKNKKCLEESLGQKEAAGIFPTRTAVTCPKIVFFYKKYAKNDHFCGHFFRISIITSEQNSPEMGGKNCPAEGRIQALGLQEGGNT